MLPHFEEEGMGNPGPVLMVHGAGGSTATWFMQLKHLSKKLHVIAIDLNGHGETPDAGVEDRFKSYLADIDSLVINYDRPVLCGHSMGGALSQLYALANREKLSGLILVGAGAKLRVNPIILQMLEDDFEEYLRALEVYAFFEETDDDLKEASKKEMRKCHPSIISRDFKACDRFDIMEEVEKISLPTLVIVGEGDLLTPPKYSMYLHENIPNSQLVVIPRAGHSVMLEQWKQFNDSVLNWFQSSFAQ